MSAATHHHRAVEAGEEARRLAGFAAAAAVDLEAHQPVWLAHRIVDEVAASAHSYLPAVPGRTRRVLAAIRAFVVIIALSYAVLAAYGGLHLTGVLE